MAAQDPTNKLPRDVFIDEIFEAAQSNKNIYLLSADLGAKALDRFRSLLKDQFFHVGISEQNMMDVAAGLAQNGKLVYTYAMAPFVTMRCYEQIKVALASMNLPIVIIGNGVGYSYNDAGPTHYATEDISCMRGLGGIEILTPADTVSVLETAKLTYRKPGFRYVRLDRAFLPTVYKADDKRFLDNGLVEIDQGKGTCILTCGYMIQKARQVQAHLQKEGHLIGIIDVYRLKPISESILQSLLQGYDQIVTLEEHFLSGGLGGAIVEAMADAQISKPTLRIGIKDHYFCENGGRDYIHKLAGIDVETITEKISRFLSHSPYRKNLVKKNGEPKDKSKKQKDLSFK